MLPIKPSDLSSIKELINNSDLVIVTLVCEDEQIEALKSCEMAQSDLNVLNPLFIIDINDEVEDTFADDDVCDIEDNIVYEEHRWPKKSLQDLALRGRRSFSSKLLNQ